MRMFPNQPLDTNSDAELRVFDQLRMAFASADKTSWFAMHSLNLPRHEYKRFGEIDFVICGPEALLVIEVKGGGVSCKNGIWETTNRYRQRSQLRESPFKQAEGALHGLRSKLPQALANAFVVGYAVVVPDAKLPPSAEWDKALLCDATDFKQFEKWLTRLIQYWRGKNTPQNIATAEQLQSLQQFLRPDFEAVQPLHAAADEVEQRIARLTSDQLRFIDAIEVNNRVMCAGGAGTGKTMLALELAKRWGASSLKTALVCHSAWLKHYLERHKPPELVVAQLDYLHIAAKRAGIQQFDALIVDEGQDVLNMQMLDKLDNALLGGITEGRWCFFYDSNNQAGLCGNYLPDAEEFLKSLNPTHIPLKTNCRNTLPILERIQTSLKADMGNAVVGNGPLVRESAHENSEAAIAALEHELSQLTTIEGFCNGDIVILSPLPFQESWASQLSSQWQNHVLPMDESSPRNSTRQKIGFAQISDFKGLESEVVVLIDLPKPGLDNSFRAQHYVGMSRARALLSLIYCR